MCNWWFLVKFEEKMIFWGFFNLLIFFEFSPFFSFTPQNKCINSWEHWKCERQTCPLMYKPSLESENLNVFKNRADLAPLPQPDIQPNTINLAQNFLCNLDLPPKFILPTLGNTDNLKDIHDNLCLSLIWCRKTSTHIRNTLFWYPYPSLIFSQILLILYKISSTIWIYYQNLFCWLLGTLMIWKTNIFTCI